MELREGMWLGRSNWIRSMWEADEGWRAKDDMGITFRQEAYPLGLLAAEEPTSGLGRTERVPWPSRTKAEGTG